MSLFQKAIIEFDTTETQCADENLGQVSRARVMVVQCSPDTYGLIVIALVNEDRAANPPNVLLSTSITDDVKIDLSESSKFTACIMHDDLARWVKFDDDVTYWAFMTAIAAAKAAYAARRIDLQDLLETVVNTVPMVDAPIPPQYAQ